MSPQPDTSLNITDIFRTGSLFYTLGDVKFAQAEMNESLQFHIKAFNHLKRTAGPTNMSTLHCKYKVAIHYLRLQDFEAAGYISTLLNIIH